MTNNQIKTLLLKGHSPNHICKYGQVSKSQVDAVAESIFLEWFNDYLTPYGYALAHNANVDNVNIVLNYGKSVNHRPH